MKAFPCFKRGQLAMCQKTLVHGRQIAWRLRENRRTAIAEIPRGRNRCAACFRCCFAYATMLPSQNSTLLPPTGNRSGKPSAILVCPPSERPLPPPSSRREGRNPHTSEETIRPATAKRRGLHPPFPRAAAIPRVFHIETEPSAITHEIPNHLAQVAHAQRHPLHAPVANQP